MQRAGDGVADGVMPNRAARRASARKARKLSALGSSAVMASSAAALAVGLSAAPAGAATTFTVDEAGDGGTAAADCTDVTAGNCSLRDAIDAANTTPGEDLIVFDASITGTMTLASDLERITEEVDIQGPGAGVLTIDGQDDYQIFYLYDVDAGTTSISGLTLTNGDDNSRISDGSGGAIALYQSDGDFSFSGLTITSSYAYNDGGGLVCLEGNANVTITNSTFDGNAADSGGGALYFYCDDLTLTNVSFLNNTSYDDGGALYFAGDALTVTGSTFRNNTSTGNNGGGMQLDGDTHTISSTIVDDNHTIEDGGGGIFHDGGTLNISDSTITGNDTEEYGGGLYLSGGDAVIQRTTVSGSEADENGGGLEIYGADNVTILSSTISGNTADGSGGGFYLASGDTLLTIANSTIANNTAGGNGGGIAADSGQLSLLQTTLSANTATTGLGDGLYLDGYDPVPLRAGAHADKQADEQAEFAAKVASGERKPEGAPEPPALVGQNPGDIIITGTIVSGNIGGEDVESDGTATVTANSSLFGGIGTQVTVTGAGNQTGVNNPGLGALANNGGPTQTMALLDGSPALDAGPDTVPAFTGNTNDQRGPGFARVSGLRVDIGAYERQLIARFTG